MTSGIATNIDELKEALLVYQNVVRVEATKALYNKMGDVAFAAAENTYFTTPDKIRKSISGLPIKNDSGIRRYGDTKYVGQYKLINWIRKQRGQIPLGGSKFRKVSTYKVQPGSLVVQERITRRRNQVRSKGPSMSSGYFMDGKYKAFIARRIRSAKFLRIGWAAAANAFGKSFTRGDFGTATLARITSTGIAGGDVKEVGKDLTEFTIFNGAGQYDARKNKPYPQRPASDKKRAYDILQEGLQRGINTVLYDSKRGIIPYLSERYDRTQKAIKVLGSKLRVI